MRDIDTMAAALGAAVADLEPDRRVLAAAIYRLLSAGRPASVPAIAEAAGSEPARVEALLATMPGVFRDEGRDVVGFWGLAVPPMPVRIRFEGGEPMHAWCAIDPFLVVPIVGGPARVSAKDPVSGEIVTMTVTPDGVEDVEPPGAVVSCVVPDGPLDHDVIQTFCHFVHFFGSRGSADAWTAEHAGTMVFSIDDAFRFSREAWSPLAG